MNNQTIELNNATIKYQKSNDVILDNISFNVQNGEMIAILGHSGVGKSTLFNSIVKQTKLVSGQIKINNENIYEIGKKAWKKQLKNIGFLTQNPNLIESETVFNNLLYSVQSYSNLFNKCFGYVNIKQRQIILETLDILGLLNKTNTLIKELSGGQQQRVEIAKLLIKNVDLILADEPTANLDYKTAREVLTLLRHLNQNQGITILVNIHDLSLIEGYFDRVIVLKNKQIIYDQKVDKTTSTYVETLLK
ncbi:phosphonate ABC transporter ATP-binding protein [Mycoplasmopsis iners]|uniref:phosphonate ABC transporter ATP-binding protein n=1 Tax=Mycoplasmopsis iners TaxID=76630 RepID=UPI00056D75BC|nr:ATP-binding cassette domain-containing protein [Mycoplasmopsis iners]